MKAISLKEPYATLIRKGIKTMESRKWATRHRGPLLICASRSIDKGAMARFRHLIGWHDILPGYAVAIVNVTGCRPMTTHDEAAVCCPVYDRAKVWTFDSLKAIEPFPVKGALSIFNVDYSETHGINKCLGQKRRSEP